MIEEVKCKDFIYKNFRETIHGTVCNSLREVEHYIHKNGDIDMLV